MHQRFVCVYLGAGANGGGGGRSRQYSLLFGND